MAENLGVNGFGDHAWQLFEAPLSLGWETIRVRRQQGLYFDLEPRPETEPRFVLPDLCRLPDILAGLISSAIDCDRRSIGFLQ
jgi:FMN phosphatase YigB (HAD superfamily)